MRNTILLLLVLLLAACSKQVEQMTPPNVIRLTIKGYAAGDSLEILVKDSVVSTVKANEFVEVDQLVTIKNGDSAQLLIRKKLEGKVLVKKSLTGAPFVQSMFCYYDNGKVYTRSAVVTIRGYAMSGTLEFVLDGTVIGKGSGSILLNRIPIGLEGNTPRIIQIRKEGETDILGTKEVTLATTGITFLFDGTRLIDNIVLKPPTDPANMTVSTKFTSVLPNYINGPVDLVFYKFELSKDVTKFSTPLNIRLPLPTDGSFSETIELPPLANGPGGVKYSYTARIFKAGTNEIPYNTAEEAVLPIREGYVIQIDFKPGQAQLWAMVDRKTVGRTPLSKGTSFWANITNLTDYFK